jgi:TonB family protein
MFDELPETNPIRNKRKPRAILAAAVIQFCLVSAIILAQMVVPERLGEFQLLTTLFMAAPPPAGHAPNKQVIQRSEATLREAKPRPVIEQPERAEPSETISSDVGDGQAGGVSDGLPGGVPGGSEGPVRVGGNIRQPQILKLVKPTYPPEAIRAHIDGVVILEATVTEQGDVTEVKVISGPPILIPAAVKAVQQWKYEPTLIGGRPISIILTATVNFSLEHR